MIKTSDLAVKRKVYYLDVARVLAIILVIAIHCISDVSSNSIYYGKNSWFASIAITGLCRAASPLFLMIGGYLSLNSERTEDLKYYYKKRFSRIIPALIIWNIFYYIFYLIYNGGVFSFQAFFAGLLNRGNAYHMWFIYTMIGIYLITPFLRKLVANLSTNELLIFFLLTIIAPSIIPFINIVTPLYINFFDPLVNGFISFYILGYILGKHTIPKKYRYIIYVMGIVGYATNLIGNITHSSSSGINLIFNYGHSFPTYFIASALFVFCKYRMENIKEGALKKLIAHVSSISFGVYWVHAAIILIIERLLPNTLAPLSIVVIKFTVTLAASVGIMTIVNKIPVINKFLM